MSHYSQWGEDLIVAKVLTDSTGFYVDVGCNHPVNGSNTYLFYQRGWRGVCIDAVAGFGPLFAEARPRDQFVHSAVSLVDGDVTFHTGGDDALGSLAPNKWSPLKTSVRSRPLGAILNEHQAPRDFACLSADVEGTEVEALRSLDFSLYRPRMIIAEYQTMGQINLDLQPFLLGLGYQIFSVTRCNLIATCNFAEDWAVKRDLAS